MLPAVAAHFDRACVLAAVADLDLVALRLGAGDALGSGFFREERDAGLAPDHLPRLRDHVYACGGRAIAPSRFPLQGLQDLQSRATALALHGLQRPAADLGEQRFVVQRPDLRERVVDADAPVFAARQ